MFNIDRNGILEVLAVQESTGKKNKIEIDYGKSVLTDLEVQVSKNLLLFSRALSKLFFVCRFQLMIKQAEKYDMKDRMEKERIETKLKVEDYVYKLNKIINSKSFSDQLLSFEKNDLEGRSKNASNFLKNNPDAPKSEYTALLTTLQRSFDGVLRRLGLE